MTQEPRVRSACEMQMEIGDNPTGVSLSEERVTEHRSAHDA